MTPMSPELVVPKIAKFQFPLHNGAYGFPRTKPRKMDPFVLICIHISGNKNTARMPEGIRKGSGTFSEVMFMARDRHFGTDHASPGNSAHDYIGRDGSVLSCIPTKFAAWNNGDVHRPNMELQSIRKIVKLRAKGINANEAYLREVECTGFPGKFKVTPAQRETVSYLIARDSLRSGIPINRETVHVHADIDGVNRRHCPFGPSESLGSIEQQIAAVIKRAREIKSELKHPGSDDDPIDEVADQPTELEALQAQLDAAEGDLERLRREQRRLARVIEQLSAIATSADGVTKILDQDDDDDAGSTDDDGEHGDD
jgi:hypothetical protein